MTDTNLEALRRDLGDLWRKVIAVEMALEAAIASAERHTPGTRAAIVAALTAVAAETETEADDPRAGDAIRNFARSI